MKRVIPILVLALLASACDYSGENIKIKESDAKYVGQAVGNFSAAEWYPGGELELPTTCQQVHMNSLPLLSRGWALSPVSTAEKHSLKGMSL